MTESSTFNCEPIRRAIASRWCRGSSKEVKFSTQRCMSNLFDLPVHKCPASQFLRRSCKVEAGDSRFSPVTCTEYYDLWRARRQCCWRLFEYSTAATSFPGDHSFSPLDHMWTDKLAMWPKWRIYSRLAVACRKDELLIANLEWIPKDGEDRRSSAVSLRLVTSLVNFTAPRG
jgi:hypothetical protein